MSNPAARDCTRILLKLSGEALGADKGVGIDDVMLGSVCQEIADAASSGTQIGVVIGGGNFFRGVKVSAAGFERTSADYIGMLATVMNALAVEQGLGRLGVDVHVLSAIPMSPVCETYTRRAAVAYLESGGVVVFAAGTGNPFFTTDTAASLRAAEIGADILIKATKVDGVYDSDPMENPKARKYDSISYDSVLQQRLGIMDAAAIAICRDNNLNLRVMSVQQRGNLQKLLSGEPVGTLISSEDDV